jgi:hypothetical protein
MVVRSIAASAAVLQSLFTPATAFAKTEAECQQVYTTTTAAGQTAQKRLPAFKAYLAAAQAPATAGESAERGYQQAAAQNSIADLISVQFQNKVNFG